VGKWNRHYRGLTKETLYGDETTYRLAAEFLDDCDVIEDWGCGSGGFKNFRTWGYVGVDGSESPFADRLEDLERYRSTVSGIMIRHVLEHNYHWDRVLDNALASFTKKMCLILFTPFSEVTCEIAYHPVVGVPAISFAKRALVSRFEGITWCSKEDIPTATEYGIEHIFYLTKHGPAEAGDG